MLVYNVGLVVNYTNGQPSVYTGIIVEVRKNGNLIIIDDESGLALWKAGYKVGSEITPNQVKG